MIRYESSVVINRPIDEVWAFMTDPFNAPRFGSVTLGVRWTSPGPMGPGTTYEGRVVILGFEARLSGTVTEWDPPHTLAVSGGGLGMRSVSFRETHQVTAQGTKIVRTLEWEPRPALKPLFWMLSPLLRHRASRMMQHLSRLLEAGRG
jgi:carbon monoxide dehydrogenase subunit G